MAIFATLDIIGVMMCELGTMEMMGWQFGVSESVAIVIVIGFSVGMCRSLIFLNCLYFVM